MTTPIRVLQVIGIMNRGGAETMIMNLYREIDKDKVQFDFLVHTNEEGKYDSEIIEMGGIIHHISRCNIKNVSSYYRECLTFFRSHPEYKVVHGHIGSCASYYLSAAKKCGCFTIAHSHSAANIRNMKDFLYKVSAYPTRYIADQLFGCSTEAGIARYGNSSIKKPNYSNFPNAIELDRFTYNESTRERIRKIFQIQENENFIGTIGRITEQKNPNMLYEIFKQIVSTNSNTKCLWVGTGEMEQEIRARVESDGLQKKIILTGVRSDVNELLQGLDCFLFPSLWEGLPVTVIEAQAAGLHCILADTISKEVEITNLIEWHNLKEPVEEWVLRCIQLANKSKSEPRFSPIGDIKKAGYDIHETAKWLTDFYLSCSEQKLEIDR